MTTDVVLGAGSGMGEAVARRLAEHGGRLLLADLDQDRLDRLAGELSTGVEVHRCDLTDPADLDSLAEATGDLGRLVLTAGLSPTMADGRRIFEVDLIGPARLLRAFEPRAGSGSVAVLLASMAGHMFPATDEVDRILDDPLADSVLDDLVGAGVDLDHPGMAYGMAKRGLIRLVRRSAAAWGARGARIVSVSPGIIDTPMGRQEMESQPVMADIVAGSPIGRAIDADEVAAVVEFLASPQASAVTGVDVLVDGGAVAQLMG
jgi:NAD(P)-dependent dehydrogenase (short-subunit alcohol dehydrogenase family)